MIKEEKRCKKICEKCAKMFERDFMLFLHKKRPDDNWKKVKVKLGPEGIMEEISCYYSGRHIILSPENHNLCGERCEYRLEHLVMSNGVELDE